MTQGGKWITYGSSTLGSRKGKCRQVSSFVIFQCAGGYHPPRNYFQFLTATDMPERSRQTTTSLFSGRFRRHAFQCHPFFWFLGPDPFPGCGIIIFEGSWGCGIFRNISLRCVFPRFPTTLHCAPCRMCATQEEHRQSWSRRRDVTTCWLLQPLIFS